MLLTRTGPSFLISIYSEYEMENICKITYKITDVQWNQMYSTVVYYIRHFHRLNKILNMFC